MNQGTKYTYVDLFCGAGGMTEGFEASNKFEGLAHIDWEIPMVRTLRHRLKQIHNLTEEDAKRKVIHMDLQLHDQLLYGIKDEHLADTYKNNHPDFIKNGLVGNDHAKGILGNRKVDVVIGFLSAGEDDLSVDDGLRLDLREECIFWIAHADKPRVRSCLLRSASTQVSHTPSRTCSWRAPASAGFQR